jgi:methionyl-tRNA formyltransferase
MNSKKVLKIAFMGGNQAGILGAMTALGAGNKIIAAVSYSENLTNILKSLEIKLCSSIREKYFIEKLKTADLLLCVHGREIVKRSSFTIPKFGAVNVHPYLYKYKGADPIARALKDHEFKASVGAHFMTEKVDEGEVLVEEFLNIEPATEVEQVYNRLYPVYCSVVLKVLEIISEKNEE